MSTALALRNETTLDPYTPRDLAEVRALAKDYAASKILGAYGTTEQVMLVMATGAELGIPPTAALRGLYVVEGRIFMSADMMVALCMRAPQCEAFDLSEQSDTAAAYTVQRKGGKLITFRFSVEDAARAQLGGWDGKAFKAGSNWAKYPGTMCRHRAAAQAARAVFPDVIMGMGEEGERDEVQARDVTPPAQVAPLPRAAAPAERIADAEVIDHTARIVAALASAPDEATVKALAAEAVKIWPGSRPDAVRAAHKAAKERIAAAAKEPAHDPATGEVKAERQPGEDG